MTERDILESSIGLAGRLSYLPYGSGKAEDCGWHSTRNFAQSAPVFRRLSSPTTWFAETSLRPSPGPSRDVWQQCRKEQKWLLKSYPEAHLGNEVLRELTLEASSPQQQQQSNSASCGSRLLSIGQLTDISEPRRTIGAPLIVSVTGEAKSILRLARPNLVEWKWSPEGKVALRLAEVLDEQSTLWEEPDDASPIRRLKSIVDLKRYDPTRWLVVQRDSGTRLFRPQYQRVPTISTYGAAAEPSRLSANPLCQISRDQTGGNVHSDVSYNPGTRSHPPQLAIIDESGLWSIWDITLTRLGLSGGPRTRLKKCGHIEHGMLDRLPPRSRTETQWHKILWVGLIGTGDMEFEKLEPDLEPLDMSSDSLPPLQRASMLLMCNTNCIKLLDVASEVYLPELLFLRPETLDCVLDIHANIQDPQYFFVLTSSLLFVVRVFTTVDAYLDKPTSRWSILYSSPHLRDAFDQSLRLTVSHGSQTVGQTTSLVFLHSTNSSWMDLFCFNMSRSNPDRVTCHHEAIHPSSSGDDPVQAMCLLPATVRIQSPEALEGPARDIAEQRTQFYQLVALRSNMRIDSTLCTSSVSRPTKSIEPPGTRIDRIANTKRERQRLIRQLLDRFVVPDELENLDGGFKSFAETIAAADTNPSRPVAQRLLKAIHERLVPILASHPAEQGAKPEGSSQVNPFDDIYQAIEEASQKGSMPAKSLLQLMPGFNVNTQPEGIMELYDEVTQLRCIGASVSVLDLSFPSTEAVLPMTSNFEEACAHLINVFTGSENNTEQSASGGQHPVAVVRQMACEWLLSSLGLGPPRPAEPETQPTQSSVGTPLAEGFEGLHLESQAESLASSPFRPRSPASTPPASAARSKSEDIQEEEDAAMRLLRAHTGTGGFVPQKRTELLDKWQVGMTADDYVFDLDPGNREKTEGMLRRARQLARMSRKRRRAETLLQPLHSQPSQHQQNQQQAAELPSLTQPAPDTTHYFSSQLVRPIGLSSSQQAAGQPDSLHTMSQPLTGAFGQRPKKKVKKRKGGF
ncbi:RNA polymerase I-specific transcription initiation factor RRN6-like protein [Xylariaceae sp. FL0804]|nr:RNA polymerase I-specific transcription initiation factor RRN6-like protein [Xylariaceae sp. FL0804]